MKRFFEHNRGRAFVRAKRALAILLVLAMTLAFGSGALADGGKTPSGAGEQSRGGAGGQTEPQTPGGADAENGRQGSGGQPDGAGVNVDALREAIETLEDETVKANLLILLDAYTDALSAKQAANDSKDAADIAALSQTAADAKDALEAAMTEAGLSPDDLLGAKEAPQDGTGRQAGQPALDTEAIAAEIAALDDANGNKAMLQGLLSAYNAALAAEQGENAPTEEERAALFNATDAAKEALQNALRSAGMNEEAPGDAQEPQQFENGETNRWRITILPDGEDPFASSAGTGLLKAVYNWLRSLFGTQD